MKLDEWSCLLATGVMNDLAERFPETSDAIFEQISESILTRVEKLWADRPSDSAERA